MWRPCDVAVPVLPAECQAQTDGSCSGQQQDGQLLRHITAPAAVSFELEHAQATDLHAQALPDAAPPPGLVAGVSVEPGVVRFGRLC